MNQNLNTDQAVSIDPSNYKIADASEINSPGLVLFKQLLMHNLNEMIRIADGPQNLRPHCKTHKMPAVIRIMLEMGIDKHKCATIAEAEMLAQAGVRDILLAYQMVGPNVGRLLQLTDKFPAVRFATLVDNPLALDRLADALSESGAQDQTIGVWLDVDSGMRRTGILPGPAAQQLYEMICTTPGVQPQGLHWYDGHHRDSDLDERKFAVQQAWQPLIEMRDRLLLQGLPIPSIAVAGTGSFPVLAEIGEPGLQLTPGTTTLYDIGYLGSYPDLNLKPALGVLTRVVSCNRPGFLTLDCGHKSISPDQPAGQRMYFPTIPDAIERGHSEEHLVIETAAADKFNLGDHLVALPQHVCPTSALHQFAYVIDGEQPVDRWEVTARDRVISI